ncbi:HAD-IA family hydrolase [Paenibacillus sp. 1_12]|uniref:HAD-IA family hydrolase n=1 Tax=Paenibacillus sp. 1_12 TaxID=1566278 RepID=UPI000B831A6B
MGSCKPDPQIYKFDESHFDNDNKQIIIFVDDQEKNLDPARDLGWVTLIADSKG